MEIAYKNPHAFGIDSWCGISVSRNGIIKKYFRVRMLLRGKSDIRTVLVFGVIFIVAFLLSNEAAISYARNVLSFFVARWLPEALGTLTICLIIREVSSVKSPSISDLNDTSERKNIIGTIDTIDPKRDQGDRPRST